MTMNKIKYLMWVFGVIAWNFGVPTAKPIYDVFMALALKHLFDIDKLFAK